MGQTVLSVRMDETTKRRFDAFCADAGMNASVAVNMFVRAVIREKRIPFDIVGNTEVDLIEDNHLLAIAEEREKNNTAKTYSFETILEADGLSFSDLENNRMEYGVDFE